MDYGYGAPMDDWGYSPGGASMSNDTGYASPQPSLQNPVQQQQNQVRQQSQIQAQNNQRSATQSVATAGMNLGSRLQQQQQQKQQSAPIGSLAGKMAGNYAQQASHGGLSNAGGSPIQQMAHMGGSLYENHMQKQQQKPLNSRHNPQGMQDQQLGQVAPQPIDFGSSFQNNIAGIANNGMSAYQQQLQQQQQSMYKDQIYREPAQIQNRNQDAGQYWDSGDFAGWQMSTMASMMQG